MQTGFALKNVVLLPEVEHYFTEVPISCMLDQRDDRDVIITFAGLEPRIMDSEYQFGLVISVEYRNRTALFFMHKNRAAKLISTGSIDDLSISVEDGRLTIRVDDAVFVAFSFALENYKVFTMIDELQKGVQLRRWALASTKRIKDDSAEGEKIYLSWQENLQKLPAQDQVELDSWLSGLTAI